MKKKVIALIMIIPLVFLITIFSVGKVASIIADIPVSGIKIITQSDEGFIYLDMANYNANPDNYIYMQAQVEPSNAKNQNYTFKVEAAEEDTEPADISIDETTGLLTLNGTGKAKVTAVSADKGYTDSVILSIMSSKVVSLEPVVKKATGENIEITSTDKREYQATLGAGEYQFTSIINPTELSSSSVTWSSSNSNVISINEVTGKASARLSGEAIITLDCDNVVEGFEPTTIKVTVPYQGGASGMVIEGKSDNELMFEKGKNVVSFLLELEEPLPGLGETVYLGITGNYFLNDSYEALDDEGKRYKVTLTLENGHPENITLKLGIAGKSAKSTLVLAFTDFKFNVYTSYHQTMEDDVYQRQGSKVQYVAIGEPSDDNVIYEWTTSDSALGLNVKNGGLSAEIVANHTGDYKLFVTAYEKVIDGNSGETEKGDKIYTIEKNIHVVRGVYSIDFVKQMGSSDGEGLLTLGDTAIDDSGYINDYYPEIKMKIQYDDGTIGGYNAEDLVFTSENNAIVSHHATQDCFKVRINGDGVSTITAKWSNGINMGVEIKTSIKLRAVKNGVMIGIECDDPVKNYRHLRKVCSGSKDDDMMKVILMKDIMLGEEKMSVKTARDYAYTKLTDYDWTYYRNRKETRPDVYYLIEFRNDIHGNGHVINAQNFTMAKDGNNPLLFRGPLDFVSTGSASVKAQDNIVFLVRKDNVHINNVDLKGCSDSLLLNDEQTGIDLTKLNYAGTTLEICANTSLTNSRVSNGRTVVRIFGGETKDNPETDANYDPVVSSFSDVNVGEERVNARIESCILSNAREFILKIGSNRAVRPDTFDSADTYRPKVMYNAQNQPYRTYNWVNADVKVEKANRNQYDSTVGGVEQYDDYFYNNYVITDVVLKNSVLSSSGLLTIGMETHFSGSMLDGYQAFYKEEWNDCASTSFASVLRMEGEVKMYDWKPLSNIDSSTLIEGDGDMSEFLRLDISLMLSTIAKNRTEFAPLIVEKEGKKMVHGGVAFYGGGYNYSWIDDSKVTTNLPKCYNVNLDFLAEGLDLDDPETANSPLYMQGMALPLAAGFQDFSFFMYDNNSTFNYEKQQSELNSGSAYILPIAPVEGISQGE